MLSIKSIKWALLIGPGLLLLLMFVFHRPELTVRSRSNLPPDLEKILFGFFVIVCAWLLVPYLINRIRQWWLLGVGVSTYALIVSVRGTGLRVNSQPELAIQLEAYPEEGQVFQTQARQVFQWEQARQLKPEGWVSIKYDPKHPHYAVILDVMDSPAFVSDQRAALNESKEQS